MPPWLGEILADPEAFLERSRPFVVDSPLITLARIRTSHPDSPVLALRRLNYGRLRHVGRDLLRRSRPERAFWHSLGLEQAGVSTAPAWAAGVQRCWRWPVRAYLITEWVQGSITLEDLLIREKRLGKREVTQLARLLARMHNAGFSHRDLKAPNILFTENRQPVLIDLDGVRHFNPAEPGRAIADLARFTWEFARFPTILKFSGRRFLKMYCRERSWQDTREARRKLEQKIFAPTARRLASGLDYWKR